MELRVQWDGYSQSSWEKFTGFVQDTANIVERYLIRNQIKPFLFLKKQFKLLKQQEKPKKDADNLK